MNYGSITAQLCKKLKGSKKFGRQETDKFTFWTDPSIWLKTSGVGFPMTARVTLAK